MALTDCKHKKHPAREDITASDSSFIIVPTLSFRQVQTSITGFRKYESSMVVGNELSAVTWQRNNPAQTQTILQRWAPGRVWPLHAVVELHSIKGELSQTGAGDCWVQSWESPDTAHFSNINCSTPLAAIKPHVTAVLPQYVLHVSEQWQGDPRNVFSWPVGTGLRLFWAPVCSQDPFWPHSFQFDYAVS